MTSLEILNAAKPLSPRLQLRDVWHLMRQFEQEGLAACLNPMEKTGRLYHLTDFGREIVAGALGINVDALPTDIDWQIYSRIVRAKIRKWVLCELGEPRWDGKPGLTATELRKGLLKKHPLALNPTIRALQELYADELAEIIGTTKKRGQKIYRLTRIGERAVGQLSR